MSCASKSYVSLLVVWLSLHCWNAIWNMPWHCFRYSAKIWVCFSAGISRSFATSSFVVSSLLTRALNCSFWRILFQNWVKTRSLFWFWICLWRNVFYILHMTPKQQPIFSVKSKIPCSRDRNWYTRSTAFAFLISIKNQPTYASPSTVLVCSRTSISLPYLAIFLLHCFPMVIDIKIRVFLSNYCLLILQASFYIFIKTLAITTNSIKKHIRFYYLLTSI